MSDLNVQQHKFIVKAGMTIDDIKNSKDATALQKKYASAFDTDGQKGFSQKEADLFNATTFSEKADGSVTFWTRQKDGTKKGTKFDSKNNNIQFKSEDDVKPYIKQVKVKKAVTKKNESVSFFDEKWSGHQIARLTGDNAVTDWLQDKDKVCTDGKDDGKIGFWEGTKSLAKGLIGGIPKAMINHPLATAVTVGLGAAATALTGGAILPVFGAIGVATGVGMAGYGGYKAVTAKTDGEAKQALETCGTGVTTTALSVAAADKALEKAAEAGVKSAQVSEDAGIIEKTVQMFKAIPESLTKSKEWARFNFNMPTAQEFDKKGRLIKNVYGESYREYEYGDDVFYRELGDKSQYLSNELTPARTKNIYEHQHYRWDTTKKDYSVLVESKAENGATKNYTHYWYENPNTKDFSTLDYETLADGTKIKYRLTWDYKQGGIKTIDTPNGTYTYVSESGNYKYVTKSDGTKQVLYKDNIVEETLPNGKTQYNWDKLKQSPKGTLVYRQSDGSRQEYYPNNRLIYYNPDGSVNHASTWSYPNSNSSSNSSLSESSFSERFWNWVEGSSSSRSRSYRRHLGGRSGAAPSRH